jgi:putative endonuclease
MKFRVKKLTGRFSDGGIQIRKKKEIGARGEGLAATFLQRHGIEILERNYRHGRGEIDIVARDGKILVFVEVKTATTHEFGPPEVWIDSRKQSQLAKVAAAYLQEHRLSDIDCRFDVITVDVTQGQKIRHIRNAFWLET